MIALLLATQAPAPLAVAAPVIETIPDRLKVYGIRDGVRVVEWTIREPSPA